MLRSIPLAAALGLPFAALAGAQTRAGGEFRVNSYTTDAQFLPAASADRAGGFVVAWGSLPGQDGHEGGAFGRRHAADGTPLGAEFQANTYTTGSQTFIDLEHALVFPPSVARDATGSFVVAWTSGPEQDGSFTGVFAQRHHADGARRGGEFQVNAYTTDFQQHGQVAVAPGGRFVIVWASHSQDGHGLAVIGQRFSPAGDRAGGEFQVNVFTTGDQGQPDVAATPDGGFVVAWQSEGQDGSGGGIFGRRFDAAGAALGGEFRVNGTTSGDQLHPGIAADDSGNFVVVWHGLAQDDGASAGVYAQRYASSGAALGGEFRVNGYATGDQVNPSVAGDGPGNFVVAWSGAGPGDEAGAFGRRFSADGTAREAEFLANTETHGYQGRADVASDEAGNFLVAWMDIDEHDGRGPLHGGAGDVFAQRFGGLRPAALRVDAAANGVWEPGETVVVRPAWRNVNGAARTFGGTLRGLTGPAGATYTLGVDGASYGSVPDGEARECTACYTATVQPGGPRPVTHWDATADERITPDALGQDKRWTLHLGGSFSDVPAASPFYRLIETLLHFGLTGGCAAGRYCPAAAATRDQMAAFVLVAKEGAAYRPPACGAPLFADVPAAHPFCAWIEELARRGVAGGCGTGRYCPEAVVTREQMAVFVLRALDPALVPPDCASPMFSDVPASSPYCRWIEELARRAVTAGCGGGRYCPHKPVTREQMAAFIGVTFSLVLYAA